MKTTTKQFKEFRESFEFWQKELGCMDYEVTFLHEDIDGAFAGIDTVHDGRSCIVRLSVNIPDDAQNLTSFSAGGCGKHEALHLFLGRLSNLASIRYVTEREINVLDEGMVRVMERLL
jgi:hypothetical protein